VAVPVVVAPAVAVLAAVVAYNDLHKVNVARILGLSLNIVTSFMLVPWNFRIES
jgi:hypothetical protein